MIAINKNSEMELQLFIVFLIVKWATAKSCESVNLYQYEAHDGPNPIQATIHT